MDAELKEVDRLLRLVPVVKESLPLAVIHGVDIDLTCELESGLTLAAHQQLGGRLTLLAGDRQTMFFEWKDAVGNRLAALPRITVGLTINEVVKQTWHKVD